MFRRLPSKRALAATFKVRGRRLERRWPFVRRASGKSLNLHFDDLLELQWARSRDFVFIVVGAFDGVENDPISRFIRLRNCRGVLIEPQPSAFERLRRNFAGFPRIELLNAAIDETSGTRSLYSVSAGASFPSWIEQIASFSLDHVKKHEAQAPGLSAQIVERPIRTLSFGDLLDQHGFAHIDVLQIDTEGMDGEMLRWFPFERIRPGLLHYETAHLSGDEHLAVCSRLEGFGYKVFEADAPSDAMAILL